MMNAMPRQEDLKDGRSKLGPVIGDGSPWVEKRRHEYG